MTLDEAIDIDNIPIEDLLSVLCVKPYGVIQYIISELQQELRDRRAEIVDIDD